MKVGMTRAMATQGTTKPARARATMEVSMATRKLGEVRVVMETRSAEQTSLAHTPFGALAHMRDKVKCFFFINS